MPSYFMIMETDLSKLAAAATSWRNQSKKLKECADDYDYELNKSIIGSDWQGEAATAASSRFSITRQEMYGAVKESNAVARILGNAHRELDGLQKKLAKTTSGAKSAGYLVTEGGKVYFDYSGTDKSAPSYEEFFKKKEKDSDSWQRKIDKLVEVIKEVDTDLSIQLRKATEDTNPNDGTKQGFNRRADDDIPTDSNPKDVKRWWDQQSDDRQQYLIKNFPKEIGNLDGIPATARNEANRTYLPILIEELKSDKSDEAKEKLKGLEAIKDKLAEKSPAPVFLLGIGGEGGGRAIVSYGNPDTAKNVSAYVPGTGAGLHSEFAHTDVERAKRLATAANARGDKGTASIAWLGYDAPQIKPDGAVALNEKAQTAAPELQKFLNGVKATNDDSAVRITAIGHSYGTLTIGETAKQSGGIPADNVVLVGSPGTGHSDAKSFGIGKENVYVGSAENDPITKIPSKAEAPGTILEQLPGGDPSRVALKAFGALTKHLADPNDDKLWFGTDPASESFGAQRFTVEPGPSLLADRGQLKAHSLYFDNDVTKDTQSIENIVKIIVGDGDSISRQGYR